MPSREGDVHEVWEAGGIVGNYGVAGTASTMLKAPSFLDEQPR